MLNTGNPEAVLRFLKMSDIDPRELIVLFDDLTTCLRPALNDHVRQLQHLRHLEQVYKQKERMHTDGAAFDASSKL